MKNSTEYWLGRLADKRMHTAHTEATKTTLKLAKAHEKATKSLQKEIEDLFDKVGNGLSRVDAMNLLETEVDNVQYDRLFNIYHTTKDSKVRQEAKRILNSQAYKYRISRKEALQQAVRVNALERANYEIAETDSFLRKQAKKEYYHSMFDFQKTTNNGFEFNQIDNSRIDEILKNRWSGENFSNRIWHNSQAMAKEFERIITEGMLDGKPAYALARDMNEFTTYGQFASNRLVRTELTYVINQADLESSKERGIKQKQFIATLDHRTSDQCRAHDNKVYDIDKLVPGKNMPPLHPFCRSIMIDVIDGLTHKVRSAVDSKNGDRVEVPADMDYQEWHNKYVIKTGNEWKDKAYRFKTSDWKQYNQYKSLLGQENVPKTFAKFQKIKYSKDQSDYSLLKVKHKAIGIYNKAVSNSKIYDDFVLNISNESNMKIVGWKFRLKSKESYLRKVETNFFEGKVNYEVKDINRYTLVSDVENLTDKTLKCFDVIRNKGYNISEIKNTWYDGSSYKGINTIIRDLSGKPFELQFHTQESFDFKNGPLHVLYEEQRVLKKGSKRWNEIQDEMVRMSMMIKNPANIESVRK